MLRMTDVSSGYGNVSVIKNLSLEIYNEEFFVLIGLNGSGKSTLLKTMLGLLPLTHGETFLGNQKLHDISVAERSSLLSFLESQPKVAFSMTVQELLEVGQSRRQASLEDVDEALHCVGLENFKAKNILELSSGEIKRAFIAHTLISHAKILLLDEPFAHLDWSHQRELSNNLKAWQKKYATTFILAVHELDRVVELAHRVGVMHQGRLTKVGKPENLFPSQEVSDIFSFRALIDSNPLDGSKRLTLGKRQDTS